MTVTEDATDTDLPAAVAVQQAATTPVSATPSPSLVAAPARSLSCDGSKAMSMIKSKFNQALGKFVPVPPTYLELQSGVNFDCPPPAATNRTPPCYQRPPAC